MQSIYTVVAFILVRIKPSPTPLRSIARDVFDCMFQVETSPLPTYYYWIYGWGWVSVSQSVKEDERGKSESSQGSAQLAVKIDISLSLGAISLSRLFSWLSIGKLQTSEGRRGAKLKELLSNIRV